MPTLKIEGVSRLDGEYPLDITSFTNRELHLIKQESGVRAGEIEEAFGAGDNDLIVVIALIVLQREGKGQAAQIKDALWDAEAGAITFDFSDLEEEEDALPPADEPPASGSNDSERQSSGPSSVPDSASLARLPSRTGGPTSLTGSTSDRATLAT